MAIVQAFSISQSAISPSEILATDTSTGVDAAIASRRIYVQTTSGSYLVPSGTTTNYTVWPYASSTITLDILLFDQAVAITVQWLNAANTVLYTLTQLYCLPQYNKQFLYHLIQLQADIPYILQDKVYFANISKYWMSIVAAINAVEIGADIAASQANLDRATNMQDNQNLFF